MAHLNINEDAQSGGELSDSRSSCNEPKSGASQPVESAFPDEDEETVTMLDVIEREDKLEEEASAVLGNSDEKNCTYPKGYISRQALYSCATCSDGTDNLAAICLACSLECHDNHEVFELYTKRNYRCDCGNSKFKPDFECKLIDKESTKSPLNEKNKYNHNFSGRYCVCDKRFPPEEEDDSAESNDEMWQCIVCEDWYHTKHLGTEDLPSKFEELICITCVDRLDFIHYYKDIEKLDPASETATQPLLSETESDIKCECILEKLKDDLKKTLNASPSESAAKIPKGPIFWLDCSWRSKLCRCKNCMAMYKEKDCDYLLDDKDTVKYYEAQGKAIAMNSQTSLERGMTALKGMNRVAVVEALNGYDELKANLSSYLRKFADNKKIVREQDIHEFFEQLKSKKKPRFE